MMFGVTAPVNDFLNLLTIMGQAMGAFTGLSRLLTAAKAPALMVRVADKANDSAMHTSNRLIIVLVTSRIQPPQTSELLPAGEGKPITLRITAEGWANIQELLFLIEGTTGHFRNAPHSLELIGGPDQKPAKALDTLLERIRPIRQNLRELLVAHHVPGALHEFKLPEPSPEELADLMREMGTTPGQA